MRGAEMPNLNRNINKKVSTERDFWRRSTRKSRRKIRNNIIRNLMDVDENIFESVEHKILWLYALEKNGDGRISRSIA